MSSVPITSIRIKPVEVPGDPSLLAYCDFDLGLFRVHGTEVRLSEFNGLLVVQFARRPVPVSCPGCLRHIGVGHPYCHFCGARQPHREVAFSKTGAPKVSREFMHPTNAADRRAISDIILAEWLTCVGVRPALTVFGATA